VVPHLLQKAIEKRLIDMSKEGCFSIAFCNITVEKGIILSIFDCRDEQRRMFS
jgi:hypothetical protein